MEGAAWFSRMVLLDHLLKMLLWLFLLYIQSLQLQIH